MKIHVNITAMLSAAVMLSATSCGEEPERGGAVDTSRYITFAMPELALAGSGSRASVENVLGGNFEVYGYCTPRTAGNTSVKDWFNARLGWNAKSAYVTPDVFSGQEVNSDGSYYSSADNGPKAWYDDNGYDANEFRYSFIAFYPAGGTGVSMTKKNDEENSMGVPELTFTMPWNGGSETTVRECSEIPDMMYASVFDHRKSGGQVAMRFNHALTAFRFKINNYTGLRLQVNSVSLKGNFFREAKINFATVTPQRMEAAGSFGGTFNISSVPQVVGSQSAGENYLGASDDNNNEGVTIMLIPALNSGNQPDFNYLGQDTKLIISYELYNEQDDTLIAVYDNVEAAFNPSSPLAGTRYAANLNFVGNEFVLIFTPESDNWESGSNNDIIIN